MLAAAVWLVVALSATVRAQSNYGSQANNIEYQGEGLPEETLLDGKVTKLDDLSPVIFLNRTKAALNCAAGSMQVELKFNEKFYGIAYADFDRHSACQVQGKGALSYRLELPLKGCGTRQDPLRVFTNNIVVRFHRGLEMDGDETITIVCRYPPPVVPAPPVPAPILYTPPASGGRVPPLGGAHILLIICAILFLSLLLLGLGVSYLCLRRRTLPPPRRLVAAPSESSISKESIQEVKIPRAHPAYRAAGSASSRSDDGSDYPCETSETDHAHTNRAFSLEEHYHSEAYGAAGETRHANATLAGAAVTELVTTPPPVPPAFDVKVRVKRPPPSPPSVASLTTDDATSIREVTSLLEQHRSESVRTVSAALPLPARAQHAPPPARPAKPPLYSQVSRPHRRQEWGGPPPPRRPRSIVSLNTEMTDTHSVGEMVDHSHARMFHVKNLELTEEHELQMERLEVMPETPIMPARKSEITSHVMDDVFLRTITEKRTVEDVERHKRLVTEYTPVPAPPPPPPRFDVTIRNHAGDGGVWEDFSDVSSASGLTLTPKMDKAPMSLPPQNKIGRGGPELFSPELVGHLRSAPRSAASPGMPLLPELPPARNPLFEDDEDVPEPVPARPVPSNWHVLTRVLKTEAQDEVLTEQERSWRLTRSERVRWSEVISRESTLRRELARAVSREEYSRVASDERFSHLYPPHKWEVIIRILAPPPDKPKNRYRKKSEWDSRSRRSSLPTLHEYDSDDTARSPHTPRASRRSSYRSDHVDMRSMSEMMVNYAREQLDSQSEVSGGTQLGRYYDDESDSEHPFHATGTWSGRSLQRSASQPSLARSATELVETWTAPPPLPSPDTTPTPGRRYQGSQGLSTFTTSEVRTFQASRGGWRQ